MRVLSASNPTIWRTLAPRNEPNQFDLCGLRRSSPPGRDKQLSASRFPSPTICRTWAPRNEPNQLALCGLVRSSPPVETNNCRRPGFRPRVPVSVPQTPAAVSSGERSSDGLTIRAVRRLVYGWMCQRPLKRRSLYHRLCR
jgi:hypothetical protein